MGTPQRPRMYPSVHEIHDFRETATGFDDKVYVAVGEDVKESKINLTWVVKNFHGKKICLLHVLQHTQTPPFFDGRYHPSLLGDTVITDRNMRKMQEVLKNYLSMLQKLGVQGEAIHIEKSSIKEGIVELISLKGIKRLIMGAAADEFYHKNMVDIMSIKAMYVHEYARPSCHISFICKGYLIKRREAARALSGYDSPHRLSSDSIRDFLSVSDVSSYDGTQLADSRRSSFKMSDSHLNEALRASSSSVSSIVSVPFNGASCVPSAPSEENDNGFSSETTAQHSDVAFNSSPPSVLETAVDDDLFEKLERAMAEAENLKREAFEESSRRRKAEKEAFEAARRAREAEKKYNVEMRLRKESEDAIVRENLALEKMANQHVSVMEELHNVLTQKSSLENDISESKTTVEELQEKIFSAVELLTRYRDERDKFELEPDRALRASEELKQQGVTSILNPNLQQFFSEFPYSEVENATRDFHHSLKIREEESGSIYKGVLRHTEVSVKVLQAKTIQGPSEYRQEVEVLSRIRHPNIITLIGACPEAFTLIYEYLPNGSLEDRLNCKENSSSLSWQTRIRIAAELCSVLIFLHGNKSHCIVHGDLKPSNILLDANFISKLSNFGKSCAITSHQSSAIRRIASYKTQLKRGTFAFMDPEFTTAGELTPQSDIYSFGIILLMLLTGKEAVGITRDVQRALENGTLHSLLDISAGDWPYVHAQQLAHLALRCAAMNRKDRPNLETEVLRVLEPIKASCRVSLMSCRLGDEEPSKAPPYFICPIFQEVMQDPDMAADGFTYEAEAIRGWLHSGHNTSPMTNVTLTHNNLVPNHALRSAIQEWLQQKQT